MSAAGPTGGVPVGPAATSADVHALTVNLAGTFTPTPDMYEQTTRAVTLAGELLDRTRAADAIRTDFVYTDIAMMLEQITAVHGGTSERTRELRYRYLALLFDALRPAAAAELPGPPPTDEELGARWIPREA